MASTVKKDTRANMAFETGRAGVVADGRYLPPPTDKDGILWIRTSALIHASPQELYERWRDVDNVPAWHEQIERVSRTGEKTSHWIMRSGDKRIEWDSEIVADEPGRRLAWRTIGGDSENAGEVVFERSPGNRATVVTVVEEYRMSKLASAWETLTGRNPKQSTIENLRHFKALAETGEIPRTEGQPHGPRGTVAAAKKSLYGEKMPTPPGEDRKAS